MEPYDLSFGAEGSTSKRPWDESEGPGLGERDAAGSSRSGSKAPAMKAKRLRQALSCTPCKTKKIKCNREHPCDQCIKRAELASCVYETIERVDPGAAFASSFQHAALTSRVAQLEAANRQILQLLQSSGLQIPEDSQTASVLASDTGSQERVGRGHSPQGRVSSSHEDDDEDDGSRHDSDTENAAKVLEELALGRARVVGRTHADPTRIASLSPPFTEEIHRSRHATLLRPASSANAFSQRAAPKISLDTLVSVADGSQPCTLASIIARCNFLPSVLDFLVTHYFDKVAWHWMVLHRPSFLHDYALFTELLGAGRLEDCDPMFLSVLVMLLAVSANHLHDYRELATVALLSKAEIHALPDSYFTAALEAMRLGSWASVPQYRTVQTILLVAHFYFHTGSGESLQSLDRYLVWLSVGIRLAKLMHFHWLGDDPNKMPLDDISVPPGQSRLKREIAKQLWNYLTYLDYQCASSASTAYSLHPSMSNTQLPFNLNDADIRDDGPVPVERPLTVMTERLLERGREMLATTHREFFDLMRSTHPSYELITRIDASFRKLLADLPQPLRVGWRPPAGTAEPAFYEWQRLALDQWIQHRLVRLHRPYIGKGYRNPPAFGFSARAGVAAAVRVVENHARLVAAGVSRVDYLNMHLFTALVALFHDLILGCDFGVPLDELDAKEEKVRAAIALFEGAREAVSPFIARLVRQTAVISEQLLNVYSQHKAARLAQRGAPAASDFGKELRRLAQTDGTVTPAVMEAQDLAFTDSTFPPLDWQDIHQDPTFDAESFASMLQQAGLSPLNETAFSSYQWSSFLGLGENLSGQPF